MKTNSIKCPKCGTQIQINGVDVKMSASNKNSKAAKRIEQMAANGIDVSQFFAMVDFNGQETQVGVIIDNQVRVLPDDDDIVKVIISGGTLRTSHLFKQHVLAKMFKMLLSYKHYKDGYLMDDRGKYYDMDGYFTQNLHRMGYDYQWKMLHEELWRQVRMESNGDLNSLKEDIHWYNKQLAENMFFDYMRQLNEMLSQMKVRRCRGSKYITLRGAESILRGHKSSSYGYLYCSEIELLLDKLRDLGNEILTAKTLTQLHTAVKRFRMYYVPLEQTRKAYGYRPFYPTQCKEWVDAYKGYGAYFSMKNLIMFHGCVLQELNKQESLDALDSMVFGQHVKGYYLLGALKDMLRYNNFDIEAKQNEWREKKLNRK
jgi:hypothetical protein